MAKIIKAEGQTTLEIPRKKIALTSIEVLNILNDGNGCVSVLAQITVNEYVKFTESAFANRGKIDGQRDTVQTTSALRIRERMLNDFEKGAILPPIVVGLLVEDKEQIKKRDWTSSAFKDFLKKLPEDSISIIDGMQRTTVLKSARPIVSTRKIRVEFWLAEATEDLTYRMLVLNSGQVPWNLRRQIEVINASLISEIRKKLGGAVSIFGIDDLRRRSRPREYQASEVIEMYLAFGLRKHQVDKESILADQFSRLDMIDAVSKENFFGTFIDVFKLLTEFDMVFSRLDNDGELSGSRFSGGRSLFDSLPSCVGFFAAASQIIWGLVGIEKTRSEVKKAKDALVEQCRSNLKVASTLAPAKLAGYLDLKTLNEVLQKTQSGKIGETERTLFLNAYKILFTNQLKSLTPCWRAG